MTTWLVPDFDKMPARLTARDQWVCWRGVIRDGKPTKEPYIALGHAMAKVNDPRTWRDFPTARTSFNTTRKPAYDGVGYVLSQEDGLVGLDIDDCILPDGSITESAARIVGTIASYTERSPSGRGLRILAGGDLPLLPENGTGRKCPLPNGDGKIEMYRCRRFLTITGAVFAGGPIEERPEELAALYSDLFSEVDREKAARAQSRPEPRPLDLPDAELLDKARTAANGEEFRALYDRGDAGRYADDRSSADLALCNMLAFWCGGDPIRVDRLFRSSALMRDKWDERHSGDGRTYGQLTTDRAVEDATAFFDPAASERRRDDSRAAHAQAGADARRPHTMNDAPASPTTPSAPAGATRLGGAVPGESDDEEAPVADEAITGEWKLTELGNAERLVSRHGKDIRYSPALGWLTYDGKRWVRDESGEVVRRMKHTVRMIYCEAEDLRKAAPDREDAVKALRSWAQRSETNGRITASIKLAESEPGIYINTDELDADPWIFNLENGTLDLRTACLRSHRREDMLTKLSPVEYDADAEAPTWVKALERWQPDPDVRSFLQRAAGYGLTGLTGEETAFFTYGTGRNGKSKFVGALESVMGDYSARVKIEALMDSQRSGAATPELIPLVGARLVVASEVQEGKRLNESFLKDITGSDPITVRDLYAKTFQFRPAFKLWIYGNHKPQIRGTDDGIWARLPLIPFTVTIPEKERDPALAEKLLAERPGILSWMVRGCLEWQKQRLSPPSTVVEASAEYRREMDPFAGFFETCCLIGEAAKRAWVKSSDLRDAYKRWSGEEDERRIPTSQAFAERLKQLGAAQTLRRVEGTPSRVWEGIGLLATDREEDAPPLEMAHPDTPDEERNRRNGRNEVPYNPPYARVQDRVLPTHVTSVTSVTGNGLGLVGEGTEGAI